MPRGASSRKAGRLWVAGGRSFSRPVVQAIAERLNATPPQVIVAWHLALGLSVIPRSTRHAGLAETLAAPKLWLTEGEPRALATLDTGERTGPDPDQFG